MWGVRTGGGLALRGLGEEDAARGFGLGLGDLDENLGADGGDLRLGTGHDTTVSGGRMTDCSALSTREAFSMVGATTRGKRDAAGRVRGGSGLVSSPSRTFLYWEGISNAAAARTATERRAWRARPPETAAAALSAGAIETVKAAIVCWCAAVLFGACASERRGCEVRAAA